MLETHVLQNRIRDDLRPAYARRYYLLPGPDFSEFLGIGTFCLLRLQQPLASTFTQPAFFYSLYNCDR